MFTALMLVLSPVQQEPQQSAIAPEVIHRVEPGIAGGFDMANPGHRMLGSFSEKGVSLEGDGWSAGLAFAAWGRAGEMSAAVPVEPRAEGCRVEYHRPGITEWYVNGPRGLEQGFTLAAAPAGEGPVRIELAVDDALEAEVLAGGRDARLLDGEQRVVLHYVGLTAWDSTGRPQDASLCGVPGGLAIEVADLGAVYPLFIDPWLGTEVAMLTPPAWPAYEDWIEFGESLALQADTLVVGAPGFSGNPGAAHVFYRDQGGAWNKVAELGESVPEPNSYFGCQVAIDGDTLVVGAKGTSSCCTVNPGTAYVFERHQGGAHAWGEVKQLVGPQIPEDVFGTSVAIDGDTLAVGASGEDTFFDQDGAVYVFGRDHGGPENWGLVQKLLSPTPGFRDHFGWAVAVEGDTLLVGETSEDTPSGIGVVQVFERLAGTWTATQTLSSDDGKFFGVSIDIEGSSLLVGAFSTDIPFSNAGAAYYFERFAGTWTLVQGLTHPNPAQDDDFGLGVSLSGNLALVGARGKEAAYLFGRAGVGDDWAALQELAASPAQQGDYGYSVVLDGDTAAIGAPNRSPGTTIGDVRSAAFDPLTGTLYGVTTSSTERLARADTSTGAGSIIGYTGFQNVLGLAFDPGAGVLYGTDAGTNQLVQIDTSTGVGQAIGATGGGRILGLAFDTSAGVLYGFDDMNDSLARIDPATGAAVLVGPLAGLVQGLEYDSWTDTLYGSEVLADQLITIDKNTGASTVVGPLGFPNVEGLAFDPVSGTLYGIDKTGDGTVLTIDTSSGAGSVVGKISTYQVSAGAAYVFALEFEPETYCTAGTSASGCQALIGATGNASASASSGFFLTISGVEGQKEGLFFCGTNGRQANPWGNGTSFVCVVPPRWRAGLLTGVGTVGACDGSFSQDLNAHWCSTCPKPLHNPGAGALAQAQLWYRDPASTSNQTSSMSDAIEFLVGP